MEHGSRFGEGWWEGTAGAAEGPTPLPPASPEPALQVLTCVEDFRRATCRAFQQSQRLVSVMADQIDPELFDDPAVLDAARSFLIARRYSRLRILLRRPLRLMGRSGRFVTMARRLTASVEFRSASSLETTGVTQYLVGDASAIVYQLRAGSWEGLAGYNGPSNLRVCLQEFERLWSATSDAARPARSR